MQLIYVSNVLSPHFNREYFKNEVAEKTENKMCSFYVFCKLLTEFE